MRKFGVLTSIATAVALACVSSIAAPAQAALVSSEYIVQVPDGHLAELTRALHSVGEVPSATFTAGPDAAAANLDQTQLDILSHTVSNLQISEVSPVYAQDIQSNAPWHLGKLNQTTATIPADYAYPTTAGENVDVWVIDSGVEKASYATPSSELYGRVDDSLGKNFATWDSRAANNTDDCYTISPPDGGHGTHVAGLIASNTYGVAKKATIIPLRVFPCPGYSSPTSLTLINALQFVYDHRRAGHPTLINMSLGTSAASGPDLAINSKVNYLVSQGITVVSAAGNDGADASQSSPGSATDSLTVGAVDANSALTSYSNYGAKVSILAPGGSPSGLQVNSVSAWNPATSIGMSGTSMATPIVTGAAALFLSQNPTATPAQVKSGLVASARSNAVANTLPAGTPNKIVNTAFMYLPSIPSVPSSGAPTLSSNSVSWQASGAPTNFPLTGYQYRVCTVTKNVCTESPVLTTTQLSTALNNLTRNTTYLVSVRSINSVGTSEYSTPVSFRTKSGLAGSATKVTLLSRSRTSMTMKWNRPTDLNGGTLKDYVISYRVGSSTRWVRVSDRVSTTARVVINGLRSGTRYTVRIVAKTQFGDGAAATRTLYTK